jgi:integrase/recombinase XerD
MTGPRDPTHFLTIRQNQALPDMCDFAMNALVLTQGDQINMACRTWLTQSNSAGTHKVYRSAIGKFLAFSGIAGDEPEKLASVRPQHISAWREYLIGQGYPSGSVCQKMTALRSLFAHLHSCGCISGNPTVGLLKRAMKQPKEPAHFLSPSPTQSLPAVNDSDAVAATTLAGQIAAACRAWLMKSPSRDTRSNYERDICQFLAFAGIRGDEPEKLTGIRPEHVSAWRDHLLAEGLTNGSVRTKMTAVRSLFSYLQTYGYTGVNPAHGDFVAAPAVPREGKTVALSPEACRRLLDSPIDRIIKERPEGPKEIVVPEGVRDRALFAILAYTGCRVGELTRLKVGSYKTNGIHKILEIHGKGGKERIVPLHHEAEERLEAWLTIAGIREDVAGPLFRPVRAARGKGQQGFSPRPMTRRGVQKLVERYIKRLKLDPNVTVHSLRVTALTTARQRGSDIIDLQDFAGHADPRTTLTYIRSRERLNESPAYVLKY